VDREAIARGVRRRQAEEALEFERDREEAIQQQIEISVTEVEGPLVDAAAFRSMSLEDAEIVRSELNPLLYDPEEGPDYFERDDLFEIDFDAPDDPHAEELARLREELAQCRRRQEAFKAYLAALGESPGEPEASESAGSPG
jgi:hypothetical protein